MEAGQKVSALDTAREAFERGDYPASLRAYEHFFDFALEESPDLYGIRLSYGLGEWAELGKVYPAALQRLQEKKESSLEAFERTRIPQWFNDFAAICGYLGCKPEVMQQFMAYHETDRELAEAVLPLVWDDLVDSRQWAICAAYPIPAIKTYDCCISSLDYFMRICGTHPGLGDEFRRESLMGYVLETSRVLLVLKHTGREAEIAPILESIREDMLSRGFPHLANQIQERLREG